jgi:hypothetical protein
MQTDIFNLLIKIGAYCQLMGVIYLYISGRDKRIEDLTKLTLEMENFDKKYNTIYKGILREVEPPSQEELDKIREVEVNIKLIKKAGRERMKLFFIFFFMYILFLSYTFPLKEDF